MNKLRVRGNSMLSLAALIWGLAFVAQSVGMKYIGPYTFLTLRSFIGGIFLIPCIWLFYRLGIIKKNSNYDKKSLIKSGIICGIVLFIASSLQQIGLLYTTVSKSGFITALYIIIVPIMGTVFFKKKCTILIWLSALISILGLYLLCGTDGAGINLGDILTFLCSIFFSIHILVIDHYSPIVEGTIMSCIQFFVCGVLSFIPMICLENIDFNMIMSAGSSVLYAGIMSSGIAYTLQILGQKNTNPVVASLLMSLESVFAAIGGVVILREVLQVKEIAGCVLVFLGIIIAQIKSK